MCRHYIHYIMADLREATTRGRLWSRLQAAGSKRGGGPGWVNFGGPTTQPSFPRMRESSDAPAPGCLENRGPKTTTKDTKSTKAAWEAAAEYAAVRHTPQPRAARRTLAALLGQALDPKQSQKRKNAKARKEGIGRIQRIDAEKRRSTGSSKSFRPFAILSGLDSYASMSAERVPRDSGRGSTTASRLAAAHSPKQWVFFSRCRVSGMTDYAAVTDGLTSAAASSRSSPNCRGGRPCG